MQKEERKWAFDLSKDKYQTRREVSLSTSSSTSSSGQIIAPLGYRGDVQVSSEAGSRTGAGKGNAPATPNMKELLKKKAWEAAYAPGRSIFMTLFMMWMTGSGVNIFNIMITLYTVANPLKAIVSVRSEFARFAELGSELLLPQLVFVAINLLTFGLGAYKAYNLGLLPTDADWAMGLSPKQVLDFSGGGFTY
ncbi:uncharacterized protein ACA1_025680 [Acanthamoeba castellanii str. Neff]|uniref:ER membrane protein complex subunit 4 n=1 Tax=Acanthamoeba castellanii (strain ATCC 30010 / Neff) TaxID=1257118 RepID=L8GG49_ACACF|nr:uncharacterized protein ACA1_025680 [Acanthamoeba castellanii str. Neff]ELR12050.1 hypothetical protein ACA1_025680 [Acanthamoeba castellanii str. Neff]